MQALDKEIIVHLNLVLKNELTAINQYFLHSRMLNDWGLTRLGAYEQRESVDEMKHADTLIQRILFLDGLPNLQNLGKLRIGQNVEEILNCDLQLEVEALLHLRNAVEYAESTRDYVSRELLEHILEAEEEHIDFLETQLGLIGRTGLQNYIQAQMGENG